MDYSYYKICELTIYIVKRNLFFLIEFLGFGTFSAPPSSILNFFFPAVFGFV